MMPKYAKQYSIAVAVLLCVPFLLFLAYHGALNSRTPRPGFYVRCGGDLTMWLVACCASASFACFVIAASFSYSAWRRERGHTLNGLSYALALFLAVIGAAFGSIFFGIGRAPCWVTPTLYAAIVLTAGLVAVPLVRMLPVLRRMPDGYKVQRQMDALQARIDRLRESPGQMSEAEDQEAADLLTECKETLSAVNEFIGKIQARPVEGAK